jgi:hypothetical protein
MLMVLVANPISGCGGVSVEARAQAYHQQQARGFMAEYERARLQGDLLAMCVKSNQVSAAYRDARDPSDAEAWDSKRSQDCRAARDALAPPTAGQVLAR